MKNLLSNMSIRARLLAILITFLIPIAILAFELNGKLQAVIDTSFHENEGAEISIPLFKAFAAMADYDVSSLQKASGNAGLDKGIAEASAEADGQFTTIAKLSEEYADDLDMTPAGLKKHGHPGVKRSIIFRSVGRRGSAPYNHEAMKSLENDVIALINHVVITRASFSIATSIPITLSMQPSTFSHR